MIAERKHYAAPPADANVASLLGRIRGAVGCPVGNSRPVCRPTSWCAAGPPCGLLATPRPIRTSALWLIPVAHVFVCLVLVVTSKRQGVSKHRWPEDSPARRRSKWPRSSRRLGYGRAVKEAGRRPATAGDRNTRTRTFYLGVSFAFAVLTYLAVQLIQAGGAMLNAAATATDPLAGSMLVHATSLVAWVGACMLAGLVAHHYLSRLGTTLHAEHGAARSWRWSPMSAVP